MSDLTEQELGRMPKKVAGKVRAVMNQRDTYLSRLENRLAEWDEGGKPYFLIDHFDSPETPVGTKSTTITVRLDPDADDHDSRLDVAIGRDGLEVSGYTRISIDPIASNRVSIRPNP